MFNQAAKTTWIPYTIPPTPIPQANKQYALSFSNNAVPTKNPSQFLQWKEIEAGLPEGAVARQFSVCQNGTPQTYWMLTWDENPLAEEEEEEA